MNIQHMGTKGEWYTPLEWINAVLSALLSIDLDPCTSAAANTVVQATSVFGPYDRSLEQKWHLFGKTGFVNPPGSCPKVDGRFEACGNVKRCSCKLPRKFLGKTLLEAYYGMDLVYLAFSVNQLRQLSTLPWPPGVMVSMAIPSTRIAYLDSETLKPVKGTGFDSAFLCVSRDARVHDRFAQVFTAADCAVYKRARV